MGQKVALFGGIFDRSAYDKVGPLLSGKFPL
jgi:hypothetical protein